MYSPGNAVVVNILMRWPVIIPVAAVCCVAIATNDPTPVDPIVAPPAIVQPLVVPTPVVEEKPLPVVKKKPRG